MEYISPQLRAYIEKQQLNRNNEVCQNQQNPKADIGEAKLTNLEQDTLEIKTDKKPLFKKAALIAASIGLAAAIVIAVIKTRNLTKIEDELTKLYDDIFDEFSKTNVVEGLNFEKPKLVFQKLKDMGGGYMATTNEILLDPRQIKTTVIPKDLDKWFQTKVSDELTIANDSLVGNILGLIKTGANKQLRMADTGEAMVMKGKTMYHELTHARDFQILLSTEGGKEKYIEYLKKLNKDFSPKDVPFVLNYKPQKIFPQNTKILGNILDANKKIEYIAKDILDAFTNYSDDVGIKYYTNFAEVNARINECNYITKIAKGILPKPEGVSDEFIEYLKTITRTNANRILNVVSKK